MRKELEAAIEKYVSEFPDLTFRDRAAYMDGFNDGWVSRERLKQEVSDELRRDVVPDVPADGSGC